MATQSLIISTAGLQWWFCLCDSLFQEHVGPLHGKIYIPAAVCGNQADGTLCLSDVGNLRPKEIGIVDISKRVSLSGGCTSWLLSFHSISFMNLLMDQNIFLFPCPWSSPQLWEKMNNTGEKGWETRENQAAPCYHGCFLGYKEKQPPWQDSSWYTSSNEIVFQSNLCFPNYTFMKHS